MYISHSVKEGQQHNNPLATLSCRQSIVELSPQHFDLSCLHTDIHTKKLVYSYNLLLLMEDNLELFVQNW